MFRTRPTLVPGLLRGQIIELCSRHALAALHLYIGGRGLLDLDVGRGQLSLRGYHGERVEVLCLRGGVGRSSEGRALPPSEEKGAGRLLRCAVRCLCSVPVRAVAVSTAQTGIIIGDALVE